MTISNQRATAIFDNLHGLITRRLYGDAKWSASPEEKEQFLISMVEMGLVKRMAGNWCRTSLGGKFQIVTWNAFGGYLPARNGSFLHIEPLLTELELCIFRNQGDRDSDEWLRGFARKAFPRFLIKLGARSSHDCEIKSILQIR